MHKKYQFSSRWRRKLAKHANFRAGVQYPLKVPVHTDELLVLFISLEISVLGWACRLPMTLIPASETDIGWFRDSPGATWTTDSKLVSILLSIATKIRIHVRMVCIWTRTLRGEWYGALLNYPFFDPLFIGLFAATALIAALIRFSSSALSAIVS